MAASTVKPKFEISEKRGGQNGSISIATLTEKDEKNSDADLIEDFMGGALVFTDQEKLIYSNKTAHKILDSLRQKAAESNPIPDEICHICQALIQIKHLFPDQNWLMEFDIFTNTATTLHVRSRWFKSASVDRPCLLLTVEDRREAIVNIVMEEAERFGLTPREKEVWLLQHNGCTYKQIAAELGITPNTVKKHMRSIHAKRHDMLMETN